MLKHPCTQTCPDRAAGCHGKCPAYLAYWEEHQKELDKRRQLCKVHDFVFDSVHRAKTSTKEGKEKYC